jgi:hypothetical protein
MMARRTPYKADSIGLPMYRCASFNLVPAIDDVYAFEGWEDVARRAYGLKIAAKPKEGVGESDGKDRRLGFSGPAESPEHLRLKEFLLDFHRNGVLRHNLEMPRLERFIGVIYRPETELTSHYAEASLSRQFDAYLWFDETRAVTPLGPDHVEPDVPDTYPFGL